MLAVGTKLKLQVVSSIVQEKGLHNLNIKKSVRFQKLHIYLLVMLEKLYTKINYVQEAASRIIGHCREITYKEVSLAQKNVV